MDGSEVAIGPDEPETGILAFLFGKGVVASKFFDFLGNLIGISSKGKGKRVDGSAFECADIWGAYQEVYVRELAFWTAVNMIANAVSKCEFKTFNGWEEVKGPEYWRWNYEPNKNQNSTAFIHKWIGQLYRNNEALVIERAGQRLVADSFSKTENAIKADVFYEIHVEDLSINGEFEMPDVLYLKLYHKDMREMLDGLNGAYGKLIAAAQKASQWANGKHGIVKIDTMKMGDTNWQENYTQLLNDFVRPYLEGNNSVMPMFRGYEYDSEKSSYAQNTRDIRALIDDVYEITGKAFQIPAVLLKGEVQGTADAINNFLTFCIDPLCDQIQEEATRKIYGYEGFAAGDYLKIDTSTIKHFDLFSNAAGVDKLISSGAFSINDIRIAAGETPIEADWANEHWITKNYSTVHDMTELGGTNGN